MNRCFQICFVTVAVFISQTTIAQEKKSREQKVREDRQRVEAEGFWIYNDLKRGYDEARVNGKPILVVLRCIPCEECVKLDDNLVDQDPVIRPLLDRFVCVRIVSTNGLDLSTFQFDTDQSFAAFMLNADGTIYGRFGTRSHRNEWAGDVSLPGLAKALQGALAMHAAFPRDKEALAAKLGNVPRFAAPELYPMLKDKYTSKLSESGNIVQSCIHCHQIGDAEREFYRSRGEPIPDELMFPYPHPKSIGLVLDPEHRATVLEVGTGSLAKAAGFVVGDELIRMNGQPLLSIADVQWVLNSVSNRGGNVAVDLRRGGSSMKLTLGLPKDWRALGDIDWRASTWGLRRMATGGLSLEPASEQDRSRAGVAKVEMALRIKHVGQYGPHAAAKNAGFQKDDILVSLDDRKDLIRESDVLRLGVQQKRPGDRVAAVVFRNGKRIALSLPVQD
ncbi:MAG TPA: peptidase [Planctomycetaceae bacterium]|nr:peptidase [Planctomycetaceae bacterium]